MGFPRSLRVHKPCPPNIQPIFFLGAATTESVVKPDNEINRPIVLSALDSFPGERGTTQPRRSKFYDGCCRKLMAAAERIFRALAEFFRGGTGFSFSGDDSDRDALRLGRQAHEFDAIVEGVIEHV